jgi:hypothetical protein
MVSSHDRKPTDEMVSIADLARMAADGESKAAGVVADYLRFTRGMNPGEILEAVQVIVPSMTEPWWSALVVAAGEPGQPQVKRRTHVARHV